MAASNKAQFFDPPIQPPGAYLPFRSDRHTFPGAFLHLFCTPEDKDPPHPIAGYIFSFQKCCSFFSAAKSLVRPAADKSMESVPEPEAFRLFLLFRTDKRICPL